MAEERKESEQLPEEQPDEVADDDSAHAADQADESAGGADRGDEDPEKATGGGAGAD
jgi:hypothetical protein